MKRQTTLAIALALATTATAQTPGTTVQQDFDAAQALTDAGKDLPAALLAWEKLESRVAASRRNKAVVRLRKSSVLVAMGRADEAITAANQGLAAMPSDDASLMEDRLNGVSVIGRASEANLDYATAADAYRRAEAMTQDPVTRLALQLRLVATETFLDPEAAAADLARAEAVPPNIRMDKDALALINIAKAELLLNRGKFQDARKAASQAVDGLGGLSERIDLNDVTARGDFAIAAALSGDTDKAHEYLAYTGAGHLPKGDFNPGEQMTLPECGGDEGLKPADAAVIEFTIDPDGVVRSSRPIYAAGGGAAGLAFARKSREWSFRPEDVAAMPAFFRHRARVELRCTTVLQRPGVASIASDALGQWLEAKGAAVAASDQQADAALIAGQRARLAALEAKPDSNAAAHIAALSVLMANAVTPTEEVKALSIRAVALARTTDMPALAQLALDLNGWSSDSRARTAKRNFGESASAALANPIYRDDRRASAVIRVMLAETWLTGKPTEAMKLLQQVADDSALERDDPLRVGALVRLASLNLARGDRTMAEATFKQSGLTAQQCALTDSPPQLINAGGDFPNDALRWGFDGWTAVEFDIASAGNTLNQRAVIAYPPFVFTAGGEKVMRVARYTKSFRPDGSLGCGGSRRRIKFAGPNG